MKKVYMRSDFPGGRSHVLMCDAESHNPELVHFILILSNTGTLWVDVFWPYDEEAYTQVITKQQFWQIFREWRSSGMSIGDSNKVAERLSRKYLVGKACERYSNLNDAREIF